MGIEARFFYEADMDVWALYLIDADGRERRILESDGKGGLVSRVMNHEQPNLPLLRLPRGPIWHAIGKELTEHGFTPKPSADTETPAVKAHLSDAVAVRDRLLAIVERTGAMS